MAETVSITDGVRYRVELNLSRLSDIRAKPWEYLCRMLRGAQNETAVQILRAWFPSAIESAVTEAEAVSAQYDNAVKSRQFYKYELDTFRREASAAKKKPEKLRKLQLIFEQYTKEI